MSTDQSKARKRQDELVAKAERLLRRESFTRAANEFRARNDLPVPLSDDATSATQEWLGDRAKEAAVAHFDVIRAAWEKHGSVPFSVTGLRPAYSGDFESLRSRFAICRGLSRWLLHYLVTGRQDGPLSDEPSYSLGFVPIPPGEGNEKGEADHIILEIPLHMTGDEVRDFYLAAKGELREIEHLSVRGPPPGPKPDATPPELDNILEEICERGDPGDERDHFIKELFNRRFLDRANGDKARRKGRDWYKATRDRLSG